MHALLKNLFTRHNSNGHMYSLAMYYSSLLLLLLLTFKLLLPDALMYSYVRSQVKPSVFEHAAQMGVHTYMAMPSDKSQINVCQYAYM